MGRNVEPRKPILLSQAQVRGLVVVKRALVVKAKLLSGQLASKLKAGKRFYIYLTPVRRAIVKIPNNSKCWWGWGTRTHCWWERKLV